MSASEKPLSSCRVNASILSRKTTNRFNENADDDLRFIVYRQAMHAQECQFIPISSLKYDFAVEDVEKTAPSQSEWVAPLQHTPIAVFEDVLDNADHLGIRELLCEHLADCTLSLSRIARHLMVDCRFMVKRGQRVGVASIKGLNPLFDDGSWMHRILPGGYRVSGVCFMRL